MWPTFQPLRPSFNYIGIESAYNLCREICNENAKNNPYQLKNVDSHLIKNSEWGAVAYLSHSKYGLGANTEVAINSASAGGSDGGVWAVTGYGDIGAGGAVSMNLENLVTAHNAGKAWNTTEGDDASTNGNVSGVYDMSGGLYEWTAGYLDPEHSNNKHYGPSLLGDSNRYKSRYKENNQGENKSNNYNVNEGRKGEAIWETSSDGTGETSWDKDWSDYIDWSNCFTVRGGIYEHGEHAGIFGFVAYNGMTFHNTGFRAVLINE